MYMPLGHAFILLCLGVQIPMDLGFKLANNHLR